VADGLGGKVTQAGPEADAVVVMEFIRRSSNKQYKKLSWCWQTRATRLTVSQGHQT